MNRNGEVKPLGPAWGRGRRWLNYLFVLACVAALAIAAALLVTRPGRAFLLGDRGFEPASFDQRLYLEPGVPTASASKVGDALDVAVDRVEAAHGRPFQGPVRVYLCEDQQSFNQRIGAGPDGSARGAVFARRLFLSPRALRFGHQLGVLTHELSHLHMLQRLGRRYTTGVPGWFQEGLAVHVADGGGAEFAAESDAKAAIAKGHHFYPESRGAFFPKTAVDHGIDHHLFYRQAGLFVAWLDRNHPDAFANFLSDLQDGASFSDSFRSRFATDVDEAWKSFITDVKRVTS